MPWAKRASIHLLVAGCLSLAAGGDAARGQAVTTTGRSPDPVASRPGGSQVSFAQAPRRLGPPQPTEVVPAVEPLPPPGADMPLPGGFRAADRPLGDAKNDVGSVTLDELVQMMMNSNPIIRQALTNVTIARGRAVQAGLYPNPQFLACSPQLAGNQTQYNAQFAQDYVTGNKIKLDSDAAWRGVSQAELQLVRTRFDVLTTLREQFYITLAAQRRLEVLEELVKIARHSRDLFMRAVKAGQEASTDALMLDIELDKAQVAWENAETLLETNKRQLAAVIGLPMMNLPHLAGHLEVELPKYDLIAVQRGVISRNALVRIAQIDVGRNEVLLQRARVEPIPNINFQGGYQNQQPGAFAPQNQALFQITVNVPLFNQNQGNIRAAQASVGSAVAQVGRVENELAGDSAAAIGRFLSAQQLVDRYEEQMLPKVQDLLRRMRERFDAGDAAYLALLQAQRQWMEINLGYVNAQEQRWTAAADVAGLLQTSQFP
jgi:outer membrane protein, heavy metal efflux system